jgi:hypothetical protein
MLASLPQVKLLSLTCLSKWYWACFDTNVWLMNCDLGKTCIILLSYRVVENIVLASVFVCRTAMQVRGKLWIWLWSFEQGPPLSERRISSTNHFPTRVPVQTPRSALAKRLHKNPHPLSCQYLQTPQKCTSHTPEPLYSESTSPTSPVSLQTPVGTVNDSAKIISHDTYVRA